MKQGTWILATAVVLAAMAELPAQAETIIDFVTVGDPGNAPDDTSHGAVPYAYSIGKYEITVQQYCDFLNATSKYGDTYGLYHEGTSYSEPNIVRSGSVGSYTYSATAAYQNRAVNYVSWGEAARYANWLHNGQPTTGVQDLTTTEDGAYYLNGAVGDTALLAVTRKSTAKFFIPTEDEWYKAAYYKGGGDDAGYWEYPTQSDTEPGWNNNETSNTGNNANWNGGGPYPLDDPYYVTKVGEFEESDSAYLTFDQGGNVLEWTDGRVFTFDGPMYTETNYAARGGHFNGDSDLMTASNGRYESGSPIFWRRTPWFPDSSGIRRRARAGYAGAADLRVGRLAGLCLEETEVTFLVVEAAVQLPPQQYIKMVSEYAGKRLSSKTYGLSAK